MVATGQRIVDVMRSAIDMNTRSGARLAYRYGIVSASSYAGAYETSVYLSGDTLPSSYIRVPAINWVTPGDYVLVASSDDGDSRIVEILPYSMYAKMAIDATGGRVYIGDGTVAGSAGTAGKVLTSGGPYASAYWGEGGGGPGEPAAESPARRAAANVVARHMWR